MSEWLFYGSLARWWPLISPVDDYREEANYLLDLLGDTADRKPTLLELGSGGGHNASHMRDRFDLTLVDLSEDMLDVSRALNPGAEHVCGDMRSIRLGRQFDTVVIHDAIDYMTNEVDLRAALTSAFVHLRVGGRAVFVPDATRDIFKPGHDVGGSDGDDGRSVRFMEWTTDPDPASTVVTTEYVFLLRHADGRLEVAHETHHTGLFARSTWLRILGEVGFDAHHVIETTTEQRTRRDVVVGVRVGDRP
jgi:SAM-dependent methyltransferase